MWTADVFVDLAVLSTFLATETKVAMMNVPIPEVVGYIDSHGKLRNRGNSR